MVTAAETAARQAREKDLAAEATAALGAMTTLLKVPLPLVVAMVCAVRAAARPPAPGATGPTDPSLWGIPVPYAVALFLVVSFNGLMLMNIARLSWLVLSIWHQSGKSDAVSRAINGNGDLLNPFYAPRKASLVREVWSEWFLSFLPLFTVGVMLGIVAITLFAAPPPGAETEGYWWAAVIATVTFHMAGLGAIVLGLMEAVRDLCGKPRMAFFAVAMLVGVGVGFAIVGLLAPG